MDQLMDLIIKADNKDIQSINNLHYHYCSEEYTVLSYTPEIIQQLTERINQPYSTLHLAIIYIMGLSTEKDFSKGIQLLQASMDLQCSEAYYSMAMLVLTNQTKHKLTYDQLIKKAMSLNNSSAFIQRAVEYSDDKFDESEKYFKRAIELNNWFALYKLGELYHDHHKHDLAIEYYNQAINKGIYHAYFNLAVMYREGEGVDVDYQKALKLFKQAKKLGSDRALPSIGHIYQELGHPDKAKKYYKKGIVVNDTFSKYNLGLIYKSENKHKKAIKCFIEGAKDSHGASQKALIYDYGVMNLNITDKEIDQLLDFHYTCKNLGAYDGFLKE